MSKFRLVNRNVNLQVKLSDEESKVLEQYCSRWGKNKSTVIRDYIHKIKKTLDEAS